jgi:hypothetical protein
LPGRCVPRGMGRWQVGADADRDRRCTPCGEFFEHGEVVIGVGQEEVIDGCVGLKWNTTQVIGVQPVGWLPGEGW